MNDGVFKYVSDRFNFNKLESLPIRGSKEMLPVYEFLGRKRKKVIQETGPERKIASEMVGRGKEMDLIEAVVKKLLAGKGSVVNVIGKAGIGKSRLIAELKTQDWQEKIVILEGRAQSTGRNLSFHPIIQLIRSWGGIREEDSPATSAEKLHDSIRKVSPEQSEEIFPFLATMMGLPLTGKYKERISGIEGEALEKLILKNLRDLVTLAAQVRPAVIILEDLHWADNSSILFLESLFRLSTNQPVLFINIFRPGFEETGDYLLNFLKENLSDNRTTILIEPLEKSDSEILICNLLQKVSLPAEIIELIIRKTEGNPFFKEEVIRSFIDEGIITVERNLFRVTEKIHQVNIPESINEVILSRVDKLDEKTRELLKTASVIGRNFYYKVLEEAADTIGEIDDRLAYLKEVQLISESKKKVEIEYLFKHALAQQATYESIVLNTKKELHLKIARSIEKVFAGNLNEFYGTLAYHYEQGDNHKKTEEYLILAGNEAMRTAASSEAIHYYSAALSGIRNREIQPQERQKILDTEEKLAYAYYANGQNIQSVNLFNKVLSSYQLTYSHSSPLSAALQSLASLISLWFKIKLLKGRKINHANQLDTKLLKMVVFSGEALATYSPKETFIRTSILLNRFGWKFMDPQSSLPRLYGNYAKVMFDYLTGQLSTEAEDDQAFKIGMDYGQVWAPTIYHAFKGTGYVELGLAVQTEHILGNLLTTAKALENSLS